MLETKHLSVRIYRREPFLNVWDFIDNLPLAADGRREGLGRHLVNALSDYVQGLDSASAHPYRMLVDPASRRDEAFLKQLEAQRQSLSADQFNRFLIEALKRGMNEPESRVDVGQPNEETPRTERGASKFLTMDFD